MQVSLAQPHVPQEIGSISQYHNCMMMVPLGTAGLTSHKNDVARHKNKKRKSLTNQQ